MANYEWIQTDDTKILFMRVASEDAEELKAKIDEFISVIHDQPENSLLSISDVTGGHFDKKMKAMLKDFVKQNEPYIKMSVIIGLQGLQMVVYNAVLKATGRTNLVLKNSKEEAVAFLSGQK